MELLVNSDFSLGAGADSFVGWELTALGEGQRADHVAESTGSHVFAGVAETDDWPEARSEPFPVLPHTDYRLLAEARTFTEGRLFLALVFLDQDRDEIHLRGIGSPPIGTSNWAPVAGVIESPASAASAHAVARLAVVTESSDSNPLSVDVRRISVQEVLGS